MKTQKGITLIALIITIVVLLILAVVAIGAAQDSNIVGYAQNAASEYETGKGKENNAISDMEALLNKYSTGGNSAGNSNGSNNGGTTDNPSGGNNGGTDEPDPTPPTPPAPVYYSKTLNANMNNYAEVLALSGSELYNVLGNRGTKITYISGANRLEVLLKSGTTFQHYAVVDVTYTNAQGESSSYAICDSKYALTLEECKNTYAATATTTYPYYPADVWTEPSQETFTNFQGAIGTIYRPITQIPVFEGEWQIDEANTTAEGKQYLSNVLIDVTN